MIVDPAPVPTDDEKYPAYKFVCFSLDQNTNKVSYGLYLNYKKTDLRNFNVDALLNGNQTLDKSSIMAYKVADDEIVDANGYPLDASNHTYEHYDYNASVALQAQNTDHTQEFKFNQSGPLTINNQDYSKQPMYIYFTTSVPSGTDPATISSKLNVSADGIGSGTVDVSAAPSGNTAHSKGNINASQTVKFVDESGTELIPASTQKYVFKSNSAEKNHQFKSVSVPVIKGYVAPVKSVDGETVTTDKPTAESQIVYKKVGKIIPVDENNIPIPNAPTPDYSNDPNDATKVTSKETTPSIPGWHLKYNGQGTVTPNDPTKDTKVVYVRDPASATITYIDDTTGKTLKTSTADGKFNDTINFTDDPTVVIKNYEDNGYKLVSNNFKSNQKYGTDDASNTFTVHLSHNTQAVTQEVKAGTATVHFVNAQTGDKMTNDTTITGKTYTQTGTKDLVTGNVTWTPLTSHIDMRTVTAPTIKGYTPNIKKQVVTITANANKEYTIKYTEDPNKDVTRQVKIGDAIVHFVDSQTGKSIHDDIQIPGKTITQHGSQDPVTDNITWSPLQLDMQTVDVPDVKNYTHQQKKQVVTLVAGKTHEYIVKYDHATKNITREIAAGDLTVHYVDANGKSLHDDTVLKGQTVTQHGTEDLATGVTNWQPVTSNIDMRTIEAPAIKGYTPDVKKQVATITVNKHKELTIKYTKDADTQVTRQVTMGNAIVHLVDSQTGKSIHDDIILTGKTITQYGMQDPVTDEITWKPIAIQTQTVEVPNIAGYTHTQKEQVVVFTSGKTNEYTVKYTKQAPSIVTDSKEYTQTIHYVYNDGSKALDDHVQTVTLTRTGEKDAATGQITWHDWPTANFAVVVSPRLDGYTADKAQVDATNADGNKDVTVTYIKNEVPENPTTPNKPEEPAEPTTPNKPSVPSKPVTPATPTDNSGVIPKAPAEATIADTPINAANVTSESDQAITPVEPAVKTTSARKGQSPAQLPQTGNEKSALSVLGLVTGLLGFGLLRSKKRKEN